MDGRDGDRREYRGWFARLHLSWPMLFLTGWLLYEFTAQPGLAALVACAKFGWTDVRTALWLRRVDPDRLRGQTCFWAYLTYGLWKVAIMATLTMIVLGFASALVAQMVGRRPGFSPVLGGALAAALIGFGLSFPIAYIALWSALRNGVRIWLGQAPHRARKDRFWPPRHGGINAAPFVGFTQVILTLWFCALVVVSLGIFLPPAGPWIMAFLVGTAIVVAFLMISLYLFSVRVIANSPQECWLAEEQEMVYQAPAAEEEMSEA